MRRVKECQDKVQADSVRLGHGGSPGGFVELDRGCSRVRRAVWAVAAHPGQGTAPLLL